MAKRITGSTPAEDGYYMPAEYGPQEKIWMIWPKRPDNWRDQARPAQQAYADVAIAIRKFTPVTMLASADTYQMCRAMLPESIQVLEMPSDDAWCRDCGPTFLIDGHGGLRACDWRFNAWGGSVDGLYASWEQDDAIAREICELENVDYYSLEDFVLEGGSFHVDGEGTVLTTEMCLLSKGRNPHLTKTEIEQRLLDYLGCQKVIWLPDGIDPDETNGHVDDVACFIRPGEVACIDVEDMDCPFYEAAQAAQRVLSEATDARGRKLKVHRLCMTRQPVRLQGAETIVHTPGSAKRENGDLCIASYLNFLITNQGVIVPQYDDENDALALEQIRQMFPEREVVGVHTREIVYGGGNIHCITQQQPRVACGSSDIF